MVRLDADQIVAAAWKVVDQGGVASFTIRAISEELGVSAMALYHHVPSKAALVTLMLEAANNERPMDPLTGDWTEDLWRLARWIRDMRKAHPAIGVLHREYRVWTAGHLKVTERWVELWQKSGVAPAKVSIAARVSTLAIIGMIDEEAICETYVMPSEDLLAAMPRARAMFERDLCPDAVFELAVRSLIAGLRANLLGTDAAADMRLLQRV